MRRLISKRFLDKIKALFLSLWTDESGNVEVGKDLDVDGRITYNGGHRLPMFTHTVTIAGKYCFTARSADNTKIDSYQDLNRLFGGRRYQVSDGIFIDLHGGTIVTDFVKRTDGAEIKLSNLSEISFEDDVFME